jgi:hypothetical protein
MNVRKDLCGAIIERDNVWIPLRDGTRLAARIWYPATAEGAPVPAILEYIPYRKGDGTVARDAITHPFFAASGYACVRVDIRGSGESGGILEDEYLKLEQDDALEVIDWIVAQPWCDGMVGMMGISWGGFNGLQIAARRPAALKAIITLCSTDDRYADDIHFKGGCLLGENLGWSSTMLAYLSCPPDPALVGEAWRDIWFERLEHEPLLVAKWLAHQQRDAFWKHGSVCEDFGAIDAATLCVGGWGDAYSNAVPRLMRGLSAPRKAIIGPWIHKYPHIAVPAPQIGFLQEALRWWDRWLKDIDTGAEEDADFRFYVMDAVRPATRYLERPGRWIAANVWPPGGSDTESFYLTPSGLDVGPGDNAQLVVSSPQTTGLHCGEFCAMWLGPDSPSDQRPDDAGSLVFDTQPLQEPLNIAGAPVIELEVACDQTQGFVVVRLCDIWPDGASTRITWGVLNLCHRDGHERPRACLPGETMSVRIALDDVAYQVSPGHRLRIAISNAYWPMIWPVREVTTLTVNTDGSRIDVPVLHSLGDEAPAFGPAQGAPPLEQVELRAPAHERTIEEDLASGRTTLRILDDFGAYRTVQHGLVTSEVAREVYTIEADDPLSARAETHWTETFERGGWAVRTETYSTMTCDATHFHVEAQLVAYEGSTCVFTRSWSERLARSFV